MFLASAAHVYEMDRRMAADFHVPTLLLMETAGRRSADFLAQTYPSIQRFLLLCGTGHNGGDGLVTARYLRHQGRTPWVIFVGDYAQAKGDTATNLAIVRAAGIRVSLATEVTVQEVAGFLREGSVLVDAILGVGAKGPLREPAASVVDRFRKQAHTVVALDLPSGLDAGSGHVESTPLKAEYTLTYQLPKLCHYVTPAATFCGEVVTLDIGIYPEVISGLDIPNQLITADTILDWYRPRDLDSHKGSYGHVLLGGGSRGKAGSIALATQSCLEMGAGLATGFIPGGAASAFHRKNLETMALPFGTDTAPQLNDTAAEVFVSYVHDKDCLAIGPGMGVSPQTEAFLRGVLTWLRANAPDKPLVLDADALNLLAEQPDLFALLPPHTILTPHPGEMARLLQLDAAAAVQRDRLEIARRLAAERGVLVVLKGAGTIVAQPDGHTWVNPVGNPGMATAGSGDVLTGAIAGLIAQGYSPIQAAVMGAYLHARAGDRVARTHGFEGVVASKLMRNLGAALKETLDGRKAR